MMMPYLLLVDNIKRESKIIPIVEYEKSKFKVK